MNAYDFTHLALLALGGSIQGRTKLQKTIYFLGILTGNLDDLGYRAHFYGPYSDEVAAAVNRLKSLGFLQQTTQSTGARDEGGFEIARQDFELTDEGEAVAQQKADNNPSPWKNIQKAAQHLKSAGEIGYMRMSVAAKTYFMLRKTQKANALELAEMAKKLGWDPTPAEINESVSFLEKLGLACDVRAKSTA